MKKTIKLFCFPHAGGLASSYYTWTKSIPEGIEVIPIELAGRGSRYNVDLLSSIDEIIDDTFNQIKGKLTDQHFAIFGHSMGSLLAYELTKKIKNELNIEPVHLFFSGSPPFHTIIDKDKHTWNDGKLMNYLNNLGGVTSEINDNKDVWELFLPIIRSDIKNYELYEFKDNEYQLNCDISILYGYDDKTVKIENLKEWNKYTKGNCKLYGFEGGHFFLEDYEDKILELINYKLTK
ncbi:thioesterase [Clostridium gasigenes]|uniref:thioesterase n=1 Tax=Clostridium gasigenes TaxID=94869 RepID=UPI0016261E53|nr:thioesterase [Clostridium gasigenes]